MAGQASISTEILARYAADAAREVDGVRGLADSPLPRKGAVRVSGDNGAVRVELHLALDLCSSRLLELSLKKMYHPANEVVHLHRLQLRLRHLGKFAESSDDAFQIGDFCQQGSGTLAEDFVELLRTLRLRDIRLRVPEVKNRVTGRSMGEHTEDMAKDWNIGRQEQDELALEGHQRAVAAQARGFFADLIIAA